MVDDAPPPNRAAPAPRFITRWDLDKTYLRSEFDTLKDMLKAAVEPAERKRAVPGAAMLLGELARGARIHILSGSPRQMRGRILAKLALDGVAAHELTLKPNLGNFVRLRWRAIRDQLGYKLPMLLAARVRDQALSHGDRPLAEVLVGDDAEADAFVYSLYADVCAGIVDAALVAAVLEAGAAFRDQIATALEALSRLSRGPVVDRILIHLDRQTPPSRFAAYGARVVPFYNYLQAAFVLAEDGRLDGAAVLRVAADFLDRHRFDADTLARSYLDLLRRNHARRTLVELLEPALASGVELGVDEMTRPRLLPSLAEMCARIRAHTATIPPAEPALASGLDYVELAAFHRLKRRARR